MHLIWLTITTTTPTPNTTPNTHLILNVHHPHRPGPRESGKTHRRTGHQHIEAAQSHSTTEFTVHSRAKQAYKRVWCGGIWGIAWHATGFRRRATGVRSYHLLFAMRFATYRHCCCSPAQHTTSLRIITFLLFLTFRRFLVSFGRHRMHCIALHWNWPSDRA